MRGLFRILVGLMVLGILTAAAIAAAIVFIDVRFASRAYTGVMLDGVDVGGKTVEELFTGASARMQVNYNRPAITLKAADRSVTYRPADFGAGSDPADTVRRVMAVGRTGDFVTNLAQRWNAYNGQINVASGEISDSDAIKRIIARFASEVERPARNASVQLDGISAREMPAQPGILLDQQGLPDKISAAISTNKTVELVLPTRSIPPRLTSAKAAVDQANRILLADVAVMVPRWDVKNNVLPPFEGTRITAVDVRDYLSFDEVTDADGNPTIGVNLRPDRITLFVTPLAPLVRRDAENARFVFDESISELKAIGTPAKGRELDITATVSQVVIALRTGQKQVPLQLVETEATLNPSTKAKDLGIVKLLAQATTNFAGSSAARVKNIKVAAARYHGILIDPGATFSFNEFLGDVSEKEGFEEGLVIIGDRTVKGVGGGVCQVSTTAYQMALRAGFPIMERYAHGYRVGYYERGMGAGFDSTVFSPFADLKFVNDTTGHILIETYFNPAGTLTFKLFGTPDGREVNISTSKITAVVPHPPPAYEPDPEGKIGEGQVKQVDYATDGATVAFTRQVKKAGVVTLNENVLSKYVPWQAVYRFGPNFTPPEGAIVRGAPPLLPPKQ